MNTEYLEKRQKKGAAGAGRSVQVNVLGTDGGGVGGGGITITPKETNTILLQTPINVSQLETVLLQSGQLKKSNSTITTSTERPFLFKNSSRSLSTDSNRLGNGSATAVAQSLLNGDGTGPFVLQTLKRLEKSQSILVIRNNTASDSNPVSPLTNSSTSLTASIALATHKPQSLSSSIQQQQQQQQQQQHSNPTTASVSTNTPTSAISFTRTSKGQQTPVVSSLTPLTPSLSATATTTTKLGNILVAASGQRHISMETCSSPNNNAKTTNATGGHATSTTTTTTGAKNLRLLNANNKNTPGNGNNNHKSHNSSRSTLGGNKDAVATTATAKTTKMHLILADVQLKHEHSLIATPNTSQQSNVSLGKGYLATIIYKYTYMDTGTGTGTDTDTDTDTDISHH
uniref:Uncharacterized protein n=1 Tax=Glossina brevipalpis TaxID=37001 RepID=A0A1A9WQK0_9MUSC